MQEGVLFGVLYLALLFFFQLQRKNIVAASVAVCSLDFVTKMGQGIWLEVIYTAFDWIYYNSKGPIRTAELYAAAKVLCRWWSFRHYTNGQELLSDLQLRN